MTSALGCLGAGIKYLNLVASGYNEFQLSKYTLDNYLRLDCAALKALNVFPQNQDILSGNAGSLFGLLN
jgi:DNA mismatch repair protein MSH2